MNFMKTRGSMFEFDYHDTYITSIRQAYIVCLQDGVDILSGVAYEICESMLWQQEKLKYINQMFEDQIQILKITRDL